jgi:hypothetical protein
VPLPDLLAGPVPVSADVMAHCPRCATVTGSQFHCGVCHETFGGLRSFNRHRTGNLGHRTCMAPDELALIERNGVWREPIDESSLNRMTRTT